MSNKGSSHKSHLKQENKPFKHHGKTQAKKKIQGRTAIAPHVVTDWVKVNKSDRLNAALQKRKNKREELSMKRRGINTSKGDEMDIEGRFEFIPKIIGILDMNGRANIEKLKASLLSGCEQNENSYILPKYAAKNMPISFIHIMRDDLHVINWCKVVDLLIVVLSCNGVDVAQVKTDPDKCDAFDGKGYDFLSAIKSQGLPPILGVLQHLDTIPPKKQKDVKKLFSRYYESEFPETPKLIPEEKQENILRGIGNTLYYTHEMMWKEFRSYLLAEKINVIGSNLEVTGYIKGNGCLNVSQIVHVTGFGDFVLSSMTTSSGVIINENPVSLQAENEPDTFVAEQTWPTEQELAEAFSKLDVVPTDHIPNEIIDEDEEEGAGLELDQPAQAFEFQERKPEELDFPDEVETPSDKPARERFQKYRGLASFRTSKWDPYENLPREYAKLFEFKEPNHIIKKYAVDETKENSQTKYGEYITLVIKDFPVNALRNSPQTLPLIISSVLPHERKLTILNFKLERWGNPDIQLKSKEPLVFHCGFRRFVCRPIYSEDTTADKFKYLKEFKDEGSIIATIFAPAMFGPANVLVYKETSNFYLVDGLEQVAVGALHSFDPKRVVIKRILLTGYPLKIHKRKAVVRYMFLDPKDINYFKPVELFTKAGLRGNIRESLGTHGYMKCVFNDFIKHGDIICLPLYRRVFPKWDESIWAQVSN